MQTALSLSPRLAFKPRTVNPDTVPHLTGPSRPLQAPNTAAAATTAPAAAAQPEKVITTELIQKYLDENQQLILAILENQNVGKLHDCAQYQAKLQQNLMYLAAIADAQPSQAAAAAAAASAAAAAAASAAPQGSLG